MTPPAVAPAPEAILDKEAQTVDRALEDILQRAVAKPASTLDPVLRYGTLWGGKRLRPVLCVRTYRALGGTPTAPLYTLAASLECVHAYSLMHDDLPCMDDDDVRRGRPAAHRVFGPPAALLAGAALLPIAFAAVARGSAGLGHPADRTRRLLAALARGAGAGGMIGGQALDLRAEGRRISLDELEALHRGKTGALLSAAPEMGALAAGVDDAVVEACAAFGAHLGLAFQIADDLLEAEGDAERLGKPVDGDRELSKSTLPSLVGIDQARRLAEEHSAMARGALERAGIDDEVLHALAEYAVRRDR